MTDPRPIFPASLEAFAADGMLEPLSPSELGSFYLLLRASWSQEPPCTLPDDGPRLAMVARLTLKEWEAAAPRLLLAFSARRGPSADRLTLEAARKVYLQLADQAARGRTQRVAAAQARWGGRRCGPDPARIRAACEPHPDRTAAPSLRPLHSPPALSPQRSSPEELNPSARAPGEEVIAELSARARALGHQQLAAWRRSTALSLLQKAIGAWRVAGHTDCPIAKASELADAESASPERVDYLVEEAGGRLAKEQPPGRRFNPVGFVIAGLGLSERTRGRPCDVPIWVRQRWDKAESDQASLIQAAAAVRARRLADLPVPDHLKRRAQGA
jgi:uncharacterized protein YdaU (DUF1376 family)